MIRDTLAWNITRSGPEKGREGLAAEEAGRPLPALTTEPAGFPPACVAEVSHQVNPVRLPLDEGLGKYQHDTANLLRELGFTAVTDDQLTEPNGTVHNVDVSARRTVGGIELLWVVECKHWNRRVPKERVAMLKAIVDGVGADRGLLMSEKPGFQSGAVQMAKQKNITLSSIADLSELAWGMQQLLTIIESRLAVLEGMVAVQEGNVTD
jgi:hypothetical protein